MATANPGFVPFSLRTQSARFKNGGMAIFAAGIVVLFAWLVWQGNLLSSNFLPHVYCYLRNPKLVGLHLVSDALIWLSLCCYLCHIDLFGKEAAPGDGYRAVSMG